MSSMKNLHMVAIILVLVGALNWGLMALFDFNLVREIFGGFPVIERWVYIFVGLSAVYIGFTHVSDCKICSKLK